MIDELTEEGVAGRLRAVGATIVVDKRAVTGAELRAGYLFEGERCLDRRAGLSGRRGEPEPSWRAATVDGPRGLAGLVAEPVDRRIGDRHRCLLLALGQRGTCAAVADGERRQYSQQLFKLLLRDRDRRPAADSGRLRTQRLEEEIEALVRRR